MLESQSEEQTACLITMKQRTRNSRGAAHMLMHTHPDIFCVEIEKYRNLSSYLPFLVPSRAELIKSLILIMGGGKAV